MALRRHGAPGEGRVCCVCPTKPPCGPLRGCLQRALTSRVKDFDSYSQNTEAHGGGSGKTVTATAMF